jgi:hypothetical protein
VPLLPQSHHGATLSSSPHWLMSVPSSSPDLSSPCVWMQTVPTGTVFSCSFRVPRPYLADDREMSPMSSNKSVLASQGLLSPLPLQIPNLHSAMRSWTIKLYGFLLEMFIKCCLWCWHCALLFSQLSKTENNQLKNCLYIYIHVLCIYIYFTKNYDACSEDFKPVWLQR